MSRKRAHKKRINFEEHKQVIQKLYIQGRSVASLSQQFKHSKNTIREYLISINILRLPKEIYKTYEEASLSAQKLKITSVKEYKIRHKLDPKLPSNPYY